MALRVKEQKIDLFVGANNIFVIDAGGATIAAGVQNPGGVGIQNSIMTDTSFGTTDHGKSLFFDDAGNVGATLDSFRLTNLPRTHGFSIEVEQISVPEPSSALLAFLGGFAMFRRRR